MSPEGEIMRGRPLITTPCGVPGCVRYAGKETPGFCNRCWKETTEGERAMILFARHAPLYSRWTLRLEPGDANEVIQVDAYGWPKVRETGLPLFYVLQALELEGAMRCAQQNVADRRRAAAFMA
jgi:hypothetical protein